MAYLAPRIPGGWGELVTRPFVVAGRTLRINIALEPTHSQLYNATVAFLHPTGDSRQEIPGFGAAEP